MTVTEDGSERPQGDGAGLRGGTVVHAGEVDGSPPPRRDREPARLATAQGLQALALLIVWIFAYLGFLSGFEHAHHQSALYDDVRTQLALGEAPTGAPIEPGTALGVVSIPSIGLDNEVFVEGTRNEQLQMGPGHVYGSVLPGQQGTSFLAGRSLTFGAPFRHVADLKKGSVVRVTTANGTFSYRVEGVRRQGDPAPAALPAGAGRLTLVTSHRDGGPLGAVRPSDTVYVDALVPQGAATAGAVGTVDPGATYLSAHVDTATLAQLVLSLQMFGVVVVACAWGWNRWNRVAVWIVGTPAVIASLWVATSLASRLLPGLF